MDRSDSWRRVAGGYDLAMTLLERPFLRASRRWLAERAAARTLEVAIGTGANVPFYPPGIALTGIDLSPEMLAGARERCRRLGVDADLRLGDAMALPAEDASYDTVVCTLALCSVPDVPGALAEMARVLRPGGSLLLLDHVIATAAPVRVVQRGLDRVTARHGEYFTRRPAPLLEAAGLTVVASAREHLGVVERVHAVRE